jgi:3-oxoacyl-[acyl-carrier protein] reductase
LSRQIARKEKAHFRSILGLLRNCCAGGRLEGARSSALHVANKRRQAAHSSPSRSPVELRRHEEAGFSQEECEDKSRAPVTWRLHAAVVFEDFHAFMKFANQVAIVTGAGRGIGHAIAFRIAGNGGRVAVVSRTEKNADRTAEEINARFAGLAKAYAVDVADQRAVKNLAEQIISEFSRIDILINNAGLTRDGLSMRMSEEDWDVVLDTNLKGAFNFIQAVERPMIKQRSGRIINISSVAGLVGNPGQANYAASKAGLLGLTKTIARELASRGITCNAVAPGFINTEMTEVLPDAVKKAVLSNIPMGRFGEAQDVANVVEFFGQRRGSLYHRAMYHRRWRDGNVSTNIMQLVAWADDRAADCQR